ncbi:type 1 glutamine amidotransferase [Allosaccharopolyspora coralli]|uniref:Type 1 glutamine amidotransferase n=1 Tax=Allosaccharopolyspora coralli TaxID=2665642 RepID=A0A5Q3Q431_9PSEU|nr:type 1 glutamine amidotransferase [Allosaccharopolyspora coralli]QGK69378.1 type 1 glutamine amidotransferase [Allosaccharopolyspora coralli]
MDTARILVVTPSDEAPPARVAEWLTEAGAEVDVVAPAREGLPADMERYSALVVMGGAMGALDDVEHPWLAGVRGLLSDAVRNRTPTLGVCLGGQLLAAATGGQVRPGRKGPEVGTLLVAKRDAATEDVLLGDLPMTPDVLQFHGDEIASLPPSAQLLASSPTYDNQAFRVGDYAWGLQFHIETDTELVLAWAGEHPDLAETARAGQLEREWLDAFHDDMAQTWRPIVERFARLAAQPPEQRPTSRFLPMA